jgi:outer membrane protein OmpA-like peptidoglycan-associated protein
VWDAAAKRRLQVRVSRLLTAGPLRFRPNSPELTAAGKRSVTELATLLRDAPQARVQIDGYVATGPGDGRLTARQLSRLRAQIIRNLLVQAGVSTDRLDAFGHGEGGRPAAPPAGRRVDVTVL